MLPSFTSAVLVRLRVDSAAVPRDACFSLTLDKKGTKKCEVMWVFLCKGVHYLTCNLPFTSQHFQRKKMTREV